MSDFECNYQQGGYSEILSWGYPYLDERGWRTTALVQFQPCDPTVGVVIRGYENEPPTRPFFLALARQHRPSNDPRALRWRHRIVAIGPDGLPIPGQLLFTDIEE